VADDTDKTEEPTAKKIEKAREEGNVPNSKDTASFVTLVVAVLVTVATFFYVYKHLIYLYHYYNGFIGLPLTKNTFISMMIITVKEMFLIVFPITLSVAFTGIVGHVLQFGFNYTTNPLQPKLSKLNFITGLKNLFSLSKLIEGFKTIVKVFAVFLLTYQILLDYVEELPTVINFDIFSQLAWLRDRSLMLIAVMLVLFFILALVDLVWTRYQYTKKLRMSKQEVKDEFKQMEGDPRIKGKIRQLQMEMAQKRMMQNIPMADVVITNPTHYAVALRYDQEKENAPRIIGKGIDMLALKIKEIARENMIQIVENPPLARELYKVCEVDDIIPQNLFKAVAEVLAYVYQVSNKGQ